jgi:PTS system nitrogen regulatory IIA component
MAQVGMTLLDLVDQNSIVAELAAADRNAAIRELVQCLADSGRIAEDAVEKTARSIITRERSRGTTGFGKGVAVPHAKIEGHPQVVAAVGRSAEGIDFASLDGDPVFGIFLIVSPAEASEAHLQAMDLVFRHLQQERFRKFLRQSTTKEAIYELLAEADERENGV